MDGSSWLVGGWLGLPRRRTARSSGGDVVAVRPVRPQGGFAAVAISNGSARETIGDSVIFAVYVADEVSKNAEKCVFGRENRR